MQYQPTAHPFYQGHFRRHKRWNEPDPYLQKCGRGNLAFVWPRDGKRNTTSGRLADIASGKGPDIFVMRNGARPLRSSWANRRPTSTHDPDFGIPDDTRGSMPWARRYGEDKYDFRTRKYGRDNRYTWADAYWKQATGKKGERQSKQNFPMAYKCNHGRWYQMHPTGMHAGFGPGADCDGPGFKDWHGDDFGHYPGDERDAGLPFFTHPNVGAFSDLDAWENPLGPWV
jgi:hypothetical protein